jgi:hypothetical protein
VPLAAQAAGLAFEDLCERRGHARSKRDGVSRRPRRPRRPRPPTSSTGSVDDLEQEYGEELGDVELDPVPDPDGPPPEIVVFDIGEVLIDETRVWACWADCSGSAAEFAAVLGAAIAQGEDHQAVFEHVAPNVEWEAFVEEHERRYGGFRPSDLYPDVRLCLVRAARAGVPVLLAGNQPSRRHAQLEALARVDGTRCPSDLGVDKPDPAFFEAVLRWPTPRTRPTCCTSATGSTTTSCRRWSSG